MRPWRRPSVPFLAAFVIAAAAASGGDGLPAAYRETVVTPHVRWEGRHAGGTVRALFFVNGRAVREPDELVQRFDVEAETVGITGKAEEVSCDQERAARLLAEPFDVVVLASSSAWLALSSANRTALWRRVSEGLPLLAYRQQRPDGPLAEALKGKPESLAPEAFAGSLPWDSPGFRGGRLRIDRYAVGSGRLFLLTGYDTHWTWFNAFIPSNQPDFDDPLVPELCYAAAAALIRSAAGKQADVRIAGAAPETPPSAGTEGRVALATAGAPRGGDRLRWALVTPFGEPAASGEAVVARDGDPCAWSVRPPRAGALLLRCELLRGEQTLDTAAFRFPVSGEVRLEAVSCAETVVAGGTVPVAWRAAPAPGPADRVLLQVYDAERRLVASAAVPARAGRARLEGWPSAGGLHVLRALCEREGVVHDERRIPVSVLPDRAADPDRFHVVAWASEHGAAVERNRLRRLRDMGITALATGGRNDRLVRMAAEEGMRAVPTNILVPANRFKAKFDWEPEIKGLDAFSAAVARYAPLGYSLADEPNTETPIEFRDRGAETIRRNDPGARVGFCGVWYGFDRDTARYFRAMDFLEPYSPLHLYTPNLWLGNERDLYRSFRRRDGIVSCWTHYAPGLDHEPYSRTVPWLWLFEGMNGVSYFDTGGEFAILPGDLRSTHESRWWGEEVAEIARGIGTQMVGMRRDDGVVRILFSPKAPGADAWARGLNEAHVPYRFVAAGDLSAGLAGARLLICPAAADVADADVAAIAAFVERGGALAATAPFGRPAAGGDGADPAAALFGVRRPAGPQDAKARAAEESRHARIPVQAAASPSAPVGGMTRGEHSVEPAGADTVARFSRLGDLTPETADQPDFIRNLFATPAAFRYRRGKGTALYLTFQPDSTAVETVLASWFGASVLPRPDVSVSPSDGAANTVYLYPFSDGPVRMVGVVRDYWRVPASLAAEGGKETAAYRLHGPRKWEARPAVLESPAGLHVYDVRGARYLGSSGRAAFELLPGRPELFALLPYTVEGLDISGPSRMAAGETGVFSVRLRTRGGTPGRHVVHMRLTGPDGRCARADRWDVRTVGGSGSVRAQIPFNGLPGRWTVEAADAVTGVAARTAVEVGGAIPLFVLGPAPVVEVRREPFDGPAGAWVAPAEEAPKDAGRTTVDLSPLKAGRQFTAGHPNHLMLTGGFTLANAAASYTVRYSVCNDAKGHGFDDPRRVDTPYPPGLGFNKPNGASWYYNGYAEIYLDDFRATQFALSDLRRVEAGPTGRVDAVFDTPKGTCTLSFALMPDHRAVFQQLTVKPTVAVGKVTVRFRTFFTGFSEAEYGFVTVDPAEKSWALMGNTVSERAYGKGNGPCAILVPPGETDAPVVVSRGSASASMAKTVNLQPGQEGRIRWALWMFPDLSNRAAHDYMRDTAADTRTRLRALYP